MNIKKNIEWEILTPDGWSDFSGIKKIEKEFYYKITYSDDSILEGSDRHKIKLLDNSFCYLADLQIGDITSTNLKIINIEIINEKISLYDLLDVDENNEYITNNVTSHNCAFVENVNSLWTSSYPTLSVGGRAIVMSTPDKENDFFHNLCI